MPIASGIPLRNLRLSGHGYALPRRIVSSAELEADLGLSGGWIEERTGIRDRRWCSDDESVITLGVQACAAALDRAQLPATDIDLVICSTSTGQWSQPHTSAAIHGGLGMRVSSAAWDLNAVCSGYVHALHAGASLLAANSSWNHVLVVGAERYSSITDPTDRRTRVLFGDGAGALVISRSEGDQHQDDGQRGQAPFLGPLVSGTEFAGHEALIVPEGEYFQMDGPAVREFGTSRIVQGLQDACERAGVIVDDLDFVAPHQSNLRMLETAAKDLGLPRSKLLTSVATAGNTASASIPITLSMRAESGDLHAGMQVGIVGYGGGLSWAASTLRW